MKDYRLVEDVDERGRIRVGSEYIGPAYAFLRAPGEVSRALRLSLLGCALGWAAYLGALLPLSAAAKTFYVSYPFIFSALPLGLATALLGEIRFRRGPLEHRHADRLENRLPACCFFLSALPAAALIGNGISLLRGVSLMAGDLIFALCAALLVFCGVFLRRQRAALRCRALPAEDPENGAEAPSAQQPPETADEAPPAESPPDAADNASPSEQRSEPAGDALPAENPPESAGESPVGPRG